MSVLFIVHISTCHTVFNKQTFAQFNEIVCVATFKEDILSYNSGFYFSFTYYKNSVLTAN